MICVAVLEDHDCGAAQPETEDETGVVQLITEDETAFGGKRGKIQRIGGESHAKGDGRLCTNKFRHSLLQLLVAGERTELMSEKKKIMF